MGENDLNIPKRYGDDLSAFFQDAMKEAKERRVCKAHLEIRERKLGFVTYFLVDEFGRLLNTEPVCSVPEKYHEWFQRFIEAQVFERDGLPVTAIDIQRNNSEVGSSTSS